MAVTRIKNNQITDSTITYQKIVPGTLVGSLFNANLTLNSNISIVGNLQISGNTTTVNSIDTLVSDPLLVLNNGYVGIPSYDVGFLVDRGLGNFETYGSQNTAWIWREDEGAFEAILTSDTGATQGIIARNFYANIKAGNITAANAIYADRAEVTSIDAVNFAASNIVASGNIVAASGALATNYTTGAIVVPNGGGVGITGDLWVQGPSTFAGNIVAGNIQLSGNINVPVGGTFSNTGVFFGNAGGIGALYAGTTTYTALPTTVLQLSGNVDSYAQVNFQNINSGAQASTDLVLTADNGNDTDGYINLGIDSSTYDNPDFPGFYPNDGYLIHHSALSTGNLVIFSHTDGSAIKLHVGDYGDANTKVTVTNTGLRVNTATTSTSTTSGALVVDGGLGVQGNIHAAAINNTPIGNTTPNTGAFTNLLASSAVATNFSTANAVITGGYIQSVANVFAAEITAGTINATQANATTSYAGNFSTANAQVTGGYADNFPIGANVAASGTFTTATATTGNIATVNTTTGNIVNLLSTQIDAEYLTTYKANITNGNIAFVVSTDIDTVFANADVINVTNANITTAVADNFSSPNVEITGGSINGTAVGATVAATGNFTTANAQALTGIELTVVNANITNGNVTTLTANTLNANTLSIATIESVSANVINLDAAIGNITTFNSYSANVTTLVADNFSSANVEITGGNVNAYSLLGGNVTFIAGDVAQFKSGNVNYEWDVGTLFAAGGDIFIDRFESPNVTVTGGSIDATIIGANIRADGYFNTLDATIATAGSFSSSNVLITGGSIDGTGIGLTTAAAANVTTLNASGDIAGSGNITSIGQLITLNSTQSTDTSSGALVVTGGAGISGNVNIGSNLVVNSDAIVLGNLRVEGTLTSINTTDLDVEDKNIVIAKGSPDALAADGAGITVDGALASITYSSSDDSWNFNKKVNLIGISLQTANVVSANILTGYVGNLSSGNASLSNVAITGGYADNLPIGANVPAPGRFTTANATNFYGVESVITTINATFGNITNLTASTVDSVTETAVLLNVTTGNITVLGAGTTTTAVLNTTTANITSGAAGTLVATNFSTANATISGGYADNFPIGSNVAAAGRFTSVYTPDLSSSNVLLTGGYIDNIVIGANTPAAATFSNIRHTSLAGGVVFATSSGHLQDELAFQYDSAADKLTVINVDLTSGNATTLVATNFSTANAQVTGGYADNFPIGANTATTGNFTTANATVVQTYLVETNVANVTSANIVNLTAGGLASANVWITGGYADNFKIGPNVATSARFTTVNVSGEEVVHTLNATSNVYLAPQTGPAATVTINPLVIGTIDNMSIGQALPANVQATNIEATTSLFVQPTGTIWLYGGTGASQINNIHIGNIAPQTARFTALNAQTATAAQLNSTSGNVTTLVTNNFSTANALVTGGILNNINVQANNFSTANALITSGSATTLVVTNFSSANVRITGGNLVGLTGGTGSSTAATSQTLRVNAGGIGVTGDSYFVNGLGIGQNLSTNGTITASQTITAAASIASTSASSGALVVTGGAGIGGNLYVGSAAVINSIKSEISTVVRGRNENSLLYVAASNIYDQVSIGGNITAANIVQGAKVAVNSTDSILLPVGTSAERPSGKGYTDVEGMIRYNTTLGIIEWFDGALWSIPAGSFSTILNRTFQSASGDPFGNVDGTNTSFTLAANSTSAATIVSLNGVVQIPTDSYNINNDQLIFTEPPALGDVIDTRVVITTVGVDTISSTNGFNQFQLDENYIRVYTGNVLLGQNEAWRWDVTGDYYPVAVANIGTPSNRVDYLFCSNINIQGGTITGAGLSQGSLDDTVIGANIARLGSFTTLFANVGFQVNSAVTTDDFRNIYVSPSGTDAVASFDKTIYRSGKFFIQLSDDLGGEYQAAEIITVHNGTVASIEVYGVTYTGGSNLATFSSNVVSNTVYLNASSAGANLKVKVTPTLMLL